MNFKMPSAYLLVLCALSLPVGAQVSQSKVEYLMPAAAVSVSSIASARSGTTLLVYPTFSNAGSDRQNVYFRVKWLDQSGAEIGRGEPWRQLALKGMSMEAVVLSAPLEAATDYRLQVSVGAIGGHADRAPAKKM